MQKKQTATASIYWHDYETFGINPKTDRPCQFAGIRTDNNLNIISDPLMIYAKPANDFLPDPDACLITGITPQKALSEGLNESDFIKAILHEFSTPNTCVAGYNSLRFDDEFTRYTLYRNLLPAYDREWQNGCSRWDIIDLVRVTHALRPDGIIWPTCEDGKPSYRLEMLTEANNLAHEAAHDALSDVIATIAVAKLIRDKQPALFDYYFKNRQKRNTAKLIDVANKKPVLHTSSMFSRDYYCTALIVPLIQHPTNANAIVCYDLRYDPSELLRLSPDEIVERLYTKKDDLKPGQERIALKSIHLNKCPVIVPAKIDAFTEHRLSIDKIKSQQHLKILRDSPKLEQKLFDVFQRNDFNQSENPDHQLYSGSFFSDRDKKLMARVHKCDPSELAEKKFDFTDERLFEMLFRFQARNYPETLDEEARIRWNKFRESILKEEAQPWMTIDKNLKRIDLLMKANTTEKDQILLKQLLLYHKTIIDF